MANRYTDIDKWEDDWFLKLSPKMKCAWNYLCDTVRGCGERKISLTKFSNDIGAEITRSEFDECFEGRVFWIDEDSIWVPGTLNRIYKTLSPNVPAHINAAKKIIRITEGLELSERGQKVRNRFIEFLGETPDQGLNRPQLVPDLKDKREKIKDKRIKKGESEGIFEKIKLILDEAYALYPRKEGKTSGMKKIVAQIKTIDQATSFKKAVSIYRDKCVSLNTETKYIKLFSTFVNDWADVLDPDYGKNTIQTNKNAALEDFLSMADEFFKVVRSTSDGDPRTKDLLGQDKFNIFVKIGRRKIGSMPDNEFSRKEVARLIKELVQSSGAAA